MGWHSSSCQNRAYSASMCPAGKRMSGITDSPLPEHVAQGSRIAGYLHADIDAGVTSCR